MSTVFIVERTPHADHIFSGKRPTNLRAYDTAEKAAEKIKSIYKSQIDGLPFLYRDSVILIEKNGLAVALKTDNTFWQVLEIEVE